MARKTPKAARKRTTQPIPILDVHAAAPKPKNVERPPRPITQPLDTPELEGSKLLADIRDRWKSGGSLLPSPTESEKLLGAYRQAHTTVEAAREALQKALAIEGTTILELARAFGANSLRIDGVVHDFACRGESIFFRRRTVGIIDTDTTKQDK